MTAPGNVLVRPDGRAALALDGRVRVGAAGDPCCCGGSAGGQRYMLARWCCDPGVTIWIAVPPFTAEIEDGCGFSSDGTPRRPLMVPGSAPVVISWLGRLGVRVCVRTEPGEVRPAADIPAGADLVRFCEGGSEDPRILDGSACADRNACAPCPDCCRAEPYPIGHCMVGGLGDGCCDCPSSFRLTFREHWEIKSRAAGWSYTNTIDDLGRTCVITPPVELEAWSASLDLERVYEFLCPPRTPGESGHARNPVGRCVVERGRVIRREPDNVVYDPPAPGDCSPRHFVRWGSWREWSEDLFPFPCATPPPYYGCVHDYTRLGGPFGAMLDGFEITGLGDPQCDPWERCNGHCRLHRANQTDERGATDGAYDWWGSIACAPGAGSSGSISTHVQVVNLHRLIQARGIGLAAGTAPWIGLACEVIGDRVSSFEVEPLEPCASSPCADEVQQLRRDLPVRRRHDSRPRRWRTAAELLGVVADV